jgi:hypothetical protein
MGARNPPAQPTPPRRRLTSKQKSLISEINELSSLLSLNPVELIEEAETGHELTARLALAKDHIVRSGILMEYTLIDEFLNMALTHSLYPGSEDGSYPRLWRRKSFQNFNYYVLERLSLLAKLDFVAATWKVPKPVVSYIQTVNSIRNGLAHSFFPENLRGKRTSYKGKSIYTLDGFKALREDSAQVHEFFFAKILKLDWGKLSEVDSPPKDLRPGTDP